MNPQPPRRNPARALLALQLPGCASWPGGATAMPEVEVTAIRRDAAPASGKITRQELRFRLERFADSFYEEIAEPLDARDQERASGLLGDVRNATQTADQALELGERLTYFFQRAPVLWRMHAHIAFLQILSHPEASGVLADARRISDSADRLSRSAGLLTNVLTQGPTPEQEALFANLDQGEQRLRGLMTEARETLATANELATTADALVARFDLGGPPKQGDEPFDIAEYQLAAHDFSAMAVELRSLVESLNTLLVSPTLSERLPTAVDAAQSSGEELLRHAVILALAVILATIFSTLVALLGYRYRTARLLDRLERRHPPTAA